MVQQLTVMLFATVLGVAPAGASYVEHEGWVGVYHSASSDPTADGKNTSAYAVGQWGIVAPVNAPSDGGFVFADDLAFLCHGGSGGPDGGVNSVYGMLIAASEGGTYSNPNDTDTFHPLPMLERGPDRQFIPGSAGPLGPAGLLQGAARWSTLAQSYCPQIAGVVIDDFWGNYDHSSVSPPPPPPPPGTPCPECPADRPNRYGSYSSGFYCCKWAASGRCTPPPAAPPTPPCCLLPGSSLGCQSEQRCGTNPLNHSVCGGGDGGQKLSFGQLSDIRAALSGKTVTADGVVDHSSPALTPWLKLFVVTYNSDIQYLANQPLIQSGIVGGISFWISGPTQDADHAQLPSLISQVRSQLPDGFPVFAAGGRINKTVIVRYLTYSSIGWMQPPPFYNLLETAVGLYDSNIIQGFYVFAGDVLSDTNATLKGSRSHMNTTEWARWDLGNQLGAITGPHLGTVELSVVDHATSAPLTSVLATVVYNASTHVTRKVTAALPSGSACSTSASCFSFGGWTGVAAPVHHTITLVKEGYANTTLEVAVVAGAHTPVTARMVAESVATG